MALAKHASVDFIVFDEALLTGWRAARLAKEMFWMVAVARVRDRARALDRLSAHRSSTERVVRFVVVVRAERLAVEHIECFIWEGFIASVAVETIAVVLALELTI
jgi:hypothetical protein